MRWRTLEIARIKRIKMKKNRKAKSMSAMANAQDERLMNEIRSLVEA